MLRPIAARVLEGSTLVFEVLDAGTRTLMRLDESGRPVGTTPLRGFFDSVEVESAVHVDGGWILAGSTSEGVYRFASITAGGLVQPIDSLGSVSTDSTRLSGYLSRDGTAALFTQVRSPFASRRVAPSLGATLTLRPSLRHKALIGGRRDSSEWISLPVVPLDSGFVQVLSDLRSSRRLMVRYSPLGQTASVVDLDAPLGFWDAIPKERLLLAARDVGRLELVVYRWRWGGDTINP